MTIEQQYIGDGVYVSYDGYNINLAVNNHNNHVIVLEPIIVERLKLFFDAVDKLNKDNMIKK